MMYFWMIMLGIVTIVMVYYDWGFKSGFKKGKKETQSSEQTLEEVKQ